MNTRSVVRPVRLVSFRMRRFGFRWDDPIRFVPGSKHQICEGFLTHHPSKFSPCEQRKENAEYDDAAPG